jgi:aminoglycoside phosphotransferase (APT) family kinase protein
MGADDVDSTVPDRIDLAALLDAFALPSQGATLCRHGNGRIHASYRLSAGGTQYLLQRLNTHVFADVHAVASNVQRVTEHLAARRRASGVPRSRRSLQLRLTDAGEPLHTAADGSCWRLYLFVTGSRSADSPPSARQVVELARCFGEFLHDMDGLDGPPLATTIPHFHDTERRYRAFEAAVTADPCARAADAAELVSTLRTRRPLASKIAAMQREKPLPERVVHNDCKPDNVLFDVATDHALCVVDLDTVMPGCALHDIGDLIRSAAGTGGEESEASPLRLDPDRYERVLSGWLDGTGDLLTPAELAGLDIAGPVVTYELALRFLTDHLLGDQYFPVTHPHDNRRRAARQLALLASMEQQRERMASIVRQLLC